MPTSPNQAYSNLFNAYAKAINKSYGRTGSLFENKFKRKHIDTNTYFVNLVAYIHQNPQHHGFVNDFRTWKWSSYDGLLANGNTKLQKDEVIDWFGNRQEFINFHYTPADENLIKELLFDENVPS